jgi:hypothetical protein
VSAPEESGSGLPWWWFLPYLTVMVVFTGIIVAMIVLGVTPVVAVGVPVTLSIAAVSALTRVAKINPVSRPGHVHRPDTRTSESLAAAPAGHGPRQQKP